MGLVRQTVCAGNQCKQFSLEKPGLHPRDRAAGQRIAGERCPGWIAEGTNRSSGSERMYTALQHLWSACPPKNLGTNTSKLSIPPLVLVQGGTLHHDQGSSSMQTLVCFKFRAKCPSQTVFESADIATLLSQSITGFVEVPLNLNSYCRNNSDSFLQSLGLFQQNPTITGLQREIF